MTSFISLISGLAKAVRYAMARHARALTSLLILFLGMHILPADARWIDDPGVSAARDNLAEWEARFVHAVQQPEIRTCLRPRKKVILPNPEVKPDEGGKLGESTFFREKSKVRFPLCSIPDNSGDVGDDKPDQTGLSQNRKKAKFPLGVTEPSEDKKPDDETPPAEEMEEVKVRLFMLYLAKVRYCEQELQKAGVQYREALAIARQRDAGYEDLDYRINPGLERALSAWTAIVNEVGQQTVAEAAAVFSGEDEMLKGLTVYQK